MDKIVILSSGQTLPLETYVKLKELELNENFPFVEAAKKANAEFKLSFDDFAEIFSKFYYITKPFEDMKEEFSRFCKELETLQIPVIEFKVENKSSVNPHQRTYKNKRKW